MPVNFLTWVLSLFWWKWRAKIKFILVLFAIFVRQIYFFHLMNNLPFYFLLPLALDILSCSAQKRCSAQCCTTCFIWKEYFLFMLVKSLFPEARRFCLRKSNPLKILYNYLHDYLKCLPWLCSELRGIDRQPAAYRRLQFFLREEEWGSEDCLPLVGWSRPSSSVSGVMWMHGGGEPSSSVAKWTMDEFWMGCRCLWTPHPTQLTAGLKLKSSSSCALGQCRGNLETRNCELLSRSPKFSRRRLGQWIFSGGTLQRAACNMSSQCQN